MNLFFALLFALSPMAHAGELSGVTLPDNVTVGGQELVLNGIGLREKFWIDVYVGGLYLPAKTTDHTKAVEDDVPKQITMHFIYNGVGADKMIDTYKEGFEGNDRAAKLPTELEQFFSWMEEMNRGDEMILAYVPGTGTKVTIKGTEKGTIVNPEFMKLIFNNYVGTQANTQLREGMLGLR